MMHFSPAESVWGWSAATI